MPPAPQAEGAQLGNGGCTLTPPASSPSSKVEKRRKAWALRDQAARLLRPGDGSKGPGVCACGRPGFEQDTVEYHLNDEGVGRTAGVLSCDSAWLCAVCARKRAVERAERVADVFDALDAGVIVDKATGARERGSLPMVTLTIRHGRSMKLGVMRAAVLDAWRKTRQGAPWARAQERYGVLGVLTAPEVTWSPMHGWHFHIHCGIPCLSDRDDAVELGAWLIDRYVRYLRAAGFDALREVQDVTVPDQIGDALNYMAKGVATSRNAVWEMAGGTATKTATRKDQSLTPFDILEASFGDRRMQELWREYADVMPGTRSCVITAKMADRLGIDAADDEDQPGEEPKTEKAPSYVGSVPSFVQNALMNKRRGNAAVAVLEDLGRGCWDEIERQIWRLAGCGEPPASAGVGTDPEPLREHRPTVDEIAAEVRGTGLRTSDGLRRVLDRHRRTAVITGRALVLPDMSDILRSIG